MINNQADTKKAEVKNPEEKKADAKGSEVKTVSITQDEMNHYKKLQILEKEVNLMALYNITPHGVKIQKHIYEWACEWHHALKERTSVVNLAFRDVSLMEKARLLLGEIFTGKKGKKP